jgi:hypothetical protein
MRHFCGKSSDRRAPATWLTSRCPYQKLDPDSRAVMAWRSAALRGGSWEFRSRGSRQLQDERSRERAGYGGRGRWPAVDAASDGEVRRRDVRHDGAARPRAELARSCRRPVAGPDAARPKTGPKGGDQGNERRGHAGGERYQPWGRICNDDKTFGVSGRDRSEDTATPCGTAPCGTIPHESVLGVESAASVPPPPNSCPVPRGVCVVRQGTRRLCPVPRPPWATHRG